MYTRTHNYVSSLALRQVASASTSHDRNASFGATHVFVGAGLSRPPVVVYHLTEGNEAMALARACADLRADAVRSLGFYLQGRVLGNGVTRVVAEARQQSCKRTSLHITVCRPLVAALGSAEH